MRIDDEDASKLVGFNIHKNSKGYAEIRWTECGELKSMLVHRLVMGACGGMVIDHINGDPMDNRKENLRLSSKLENAQNHKVYKTNTTGVTGVSWHKGAGKYTARISANGVRHILGYFDTIEEAAKEYKKAVVILHPKARRLH